MIVLIDNYDSFTYNLFQQIAAIYRNIQVVRNDQVSLEELQKMNPKAIILSPGPKRPEDAGICIEIVQKLGTSIPILGVCLGLQAIAVAYGGKVIKAPKCVHGKPGIIFHKRQGLFENLKLPFTAGRYHSLIVEKESLPKEIEINAFSDDQLVMAIKHRLYPIYGVQFHPESILTKSGNVLIQNFLKIAQII